MRSLRKENLKMFICNGLDENSVAYIVNYVKHKAYVVSYLVISYHMYE